MKTKIIISLLFFLFSCSTVDKTKKQTFKHNEAGKEFISQKKYSKAITEFNKAIEKDNKYDTAYINLGILYVLLGNSDAAINVLQKAIEINPDEPNRYAMLAAAFLSNKEYSKAKELLNKAKLLCDNKNEESEIVYSTFGLYYMNTGDYGRALYNLTRVSEINPLNPAHFAQRALLYYSGNEYQNALRDINKAIRIDSANNDYLNLQIKIMQEIRKD